MFKSLKLQFITVLCASVLGCGGGGGGSSVNMTIAGPQSVNAHISEGALMNDVTVTGMVSGDVSSLSGKTVYVLVEDPDSLFETYPYVYLSGSYSYSLQLRGARLNTAGQYNGFLKIHACLDVVCNQELTGSPAQIPYSVTVRTGLTVNTTPLTFNTVFGQAMQTRQVSVTLPQNMATWGYSVVDENNITSSIITATSASAGTAGQTVAINVNFFPSNVGTYTHTLNVTATTTQGDLYTKSVPLNYTITDDPAVIAFYTPTSLTQSIAYNNNLNVQTWFNLLTRSGATASSPQIEYLNYPTSATGHPALGQWLILYPYTTYSMCYNTVNTSDCLPVGTYTAKIKQTVTYNGDTYELSLPVEVTITP